MSTRKKIAVVCNGWHVTNADVADYDDVIAVNRASMSVSAGYTVCADYQAVETFTPKNPETIFIADKYNAGQIKRFHRIPQRRVVTFEGDPVYNMSIFLAIWFAANMLAADEIDVYGARWEGVDDADGYRDEHQKRSNKRWAKERKFFGEAKKEFAIRGIVVRRIVPGV